MSNAVMIQGAGSNVGKSMLVAGLCRACVRRGISVRPFKPQNMSNNAAVTVDGGEIGRAQALQALACGVPAHTDMNPVLLKPETETGAQVVVQGKRIATLKAREYSTLKPQLMAPVLDSFRRLSTEADLILIEGAGSPAEVNLRVGDIANMGFAAAAYVPVILVGDIDRGGVIAQLVGTNVVVDKPDADLIKGFIVNKFRGDPVLFDDGYNLIAKDTNWQGLGVVPWFADAHLLPAEDALDISSGPKGGAIKIGCLTLSRIANFDDLDPLAAEPDVSLEMIRAGQAVPGDLDLLIIPGSKSTMGDLKFLRDQGWDIDIAAHVRRGGRVLGLCGGYQMLGKSIDDPLGIEGPAGTTKGLGLLDISTEMTPKKSLTEISAKHVETGEIFQGYEIHIGKSEGSDCLRPFARNNKRSEGATSADGRIMGTYCHGLFAADGFRRGFLKTLGNVTNSTNYAKTVDDTLDKLADHLEKHIDIDALLAIAKKGI